MGASHSFSILTCLFFALIFHPSLSTGALIRSPGLHRRQQAADPQTPVVINTTIHGPHGTDLSSSFKTMVFHSQLANLSSLPANLTDKRRRSLLRSRNDDDPDPDVDYSQPRAMFRTIISCKEAINMNWHFVRSECDHSKSVQDYTIWCRQYVREYASPRVWGHYGPPQPLRASCAKEETCINGPSRTRQGQVAVAWCIKQDAFVELALDATGRGGRGGGISASTSASSSVADMGRVGAESLSASSLGAGTEGGGGGGSNGSGGGSGSGNVRSGGVAFFEQLQQEKSPDGSSDADDGGGGNNSGGGISDKDQTWHLSGASMSAVASQVDGTSPLSVQTLDVEAGVLGSGGGSGGGLVGVDGTAVQEKRCQNCVDLEMGQFSPGTEALRTEMTVLSTAATGVLWLALFAAV